MPGLIAVGDVELEVNVTRAAGYGPEVVTGYGVEVRGRIDLGRTRYAVRAAMPQAGPWAVEILDAGPVDAGPAPTLPELAGFAGFDHVQVLAALPGALVDLTEAITVSRVRLLVDPVAQSLVRVDCTLTQSRDWPVVDGAVTVTGGRVDVQIDRRPDGGWTTSGVLRGSVRLGDGDGALTFEAVMSVPVRDGELWTLALDETTPLRLPSMAQALALLGGGDVDLPDGLASMQGLVITRFAIGVDPTQYTIGHLSLAFEQAGTSWVVIEDGLEVSDLSAAFVVDPTTTPMSVVGSITGTATLSGRPVDVSAIRNDVDDDWQLLVAFAKPVHVGGFGDLDAWLAGDRARDALPPTLPAAGGFTLSRLYLTFRNGGLALFGFTIHAPGQWAIVPGRLALEDAEVTLQLPYPVVADGVLGVASGVLAIGAARLRLAARKPDAGHPWVFTADLDEDRTFDLADVSPAALPPDARQLGVPAAITLHRLNVRGVPDTGALHFDARAATDWSLSFGATRFALTAIGATVDIPDRDSPTTATLTGDIDLAGLRARLTMQLGASQTVLTGTLTAQEAAAVSIGRLTQEVGGRAGWTAAAPPAIASLGFSGAAAYLNLSTARLMLYGRFGEGTALAADAFLYLARGPKRMAYAVALSLGPAFRFDTLLPAAWGVDDHLRVTRARAVICDLADTTLGELAREAGELLADADPAFPAPLAGLDAESMTLGTGFSLVASVDLTRATLFSRLAQIGTAGAPATLTVAALVDRAEPDRTVFTADLPDITIAGTVRLTHDDAHPGIHLSYRPARADRFALHGRVELLALFGRTYRFDVELTVDDAGLTTSVQQRGTQDLDEPFGLPGLRLTGVGLDVAYRWAPPATSSIGLRGRVLLGPAPHSGEADNRLDCAAELALHDGAPVLLDIALARDWSLGAFLAQCLTGSAAAWPGDFVEIRLRAGTRLYYYDEAPDPGRRYAPGHHDGFHLDARLTLTLFTEIDLHAVVSVLRDPATRRFNRISGSAVLDHPLDAGFLSLAGSAKPAGSATYTGGPALSVETGPAAAIRLATGVNFLGEAFGVVDVAVTSGAHGSRSFHGRLRAAKSLAPFGVLDCGFRYTVRPGPAGGTFAIEQWPAFDWAGPLIDFITAIKDMATSTTCGVLTKLVANTPFTTTLTLNPVVGLVDDHLRFTLQGRYALTLTKSGVEFLGADFPTFDVDIPVATRWDDLPSTLAAGIGRASSQFAAAMMRNPVKIAIFLAVVVGPDALEVVKVLLCNELVDAIAVTCVEVALTVLTTLLAGSGVLAAAAIAILLAAVTAAAGGSKPDEGDGPPPGTPMLHATAFTDGAVTAVWSAADRSASYTLGVFGAGRLLHSAEVGLLLSGRVPVDADALAAGHYEVRVQATRNKLHGGWSAPLTLTKPAAPAVSLAYDHPWLTAAATAVADVDTYTFRFTDPHGARIGADEQVRSAYPNTCATRAPVPAPVDGAYTATVRVTHAGQFPARGAPPRPTS